MQRWILPLLISSSTFIFLFEDIIFGQHRSPFFPRLAVQQVAQAASTPLEEAWQSLHRARQRREQVSQALAALGEAESLAGQVQEVSQQGLLLRTIATEYARLGEFDRAIATAHQLDYETKPPGGGLVSLRTEAEQAIVQAYLSDGQLDQALQFAQGINDDPTREQGLERVVQALAEQGRLDQAIAISAQANNGSRHQFRLQESIVKGYSIVGHYQAGFDFTQTIVDPSQRMNAQVMLMQAALLEGQYAKAETIARQLEVSEHNSELIGIRRYGLRQVALAYGQVGQMDPAMAMLDIVYSPAYESQLIGDLAQVGAYEQAIVRANAIEDSYAQAHARINLAEAYVKSGQYQAALDMARQVEDGRLRPLVDYEDLKVELLYQLVEQAAQSGQQHPLVIEAAQAYGEKAVQVKAFLKASRQYRLIGQAEDATNTLARAFEIAKTIDKIGVYPDRHIYYEISNASLLIEIAEEAMALAQPDLALMALETAAYSARIFETTTQDYSLQRQATDLNQVARLLIELDQPEQSVAAVNEALTLIETVDPAQSIGLLAESGTALWLAGERDRANEILGRAQTLGEGINGSGTALIQAYVITGQADLAEAATEKVLQTLQQLEDHQRAWQMKQLALVTAGLESPEVSLSIIERMDMKRDQIQSLSEIMVQYVDADRPEQATELMRRILETADMIWNEPERDGALSVALYDGYKFYQKSPWSPDFVMPLSEAIQNPQVRVDAWSGLIWVYATEGDSRAAHEALRRALDGVSEWPSPWDRQARIWFLFEQAMSKHELALTSQIAEAFESPAHQVMALRRVAYRYHLLGQTTVASNELDRAQRAATQIADDAHRQQLLDAIAQQRKL